jgi:tetratricopeptide (TPR) repeat protein
MGMDDRETFDDVAERSTKGSSEITLPISMRTPLGSYLAAVGCAFFCALFLLYLGYTYAAAIAAILSALVFTVLAFTDRIVFDGRRLTRTGIVPRIVGYFTRTRSSLRIGHVEQVETFIRRAVKRNGRVLCSYRTVFRGRGRMYVIGSGGKRSLRMIKAVLSFLPDDVMDSRSRELFNYYADIHEVRRRAVLSNIPAVEVLEAVVPGLRNGRRMLPIAKEIEPSPEEIRKAVGLRRLANELRTSGSLLQAAEAFRRSLVIRPQDAWTLFDLARCLYSFAGAERDKRLERRAIALMRLAEKRAGNDNELLMMLGESYFQFGDWRRARAMFRRAIDGVGERFRSLRGLAEVALREGKLAHVIHNFGAANRVAATSALRRWSGAEAEYFSRLNDDDEYMELEISRVNLLDSFSGVRRAAARLIFMGLVVIVGGLLIEDGLITNIGWAVAGISIVVWIVMNILTRMLADRIPFELLERE